MAGQRERRFRRQVEKVLEPVVGDVATRLPLDHHGSLIVSRHSGAQQIELGLVADLPCKLCLAQRGVRLLE
jgi:hypothetical protein